MDGEDMTAASIVKKAVLLTQRQSIPRTQLTVRINALTMTRLKALADDHSVSVNELTASILDTAITAHFEEGHS